MKSPGLTKLELNAMEAFWNYGASSIREFQETSPENQILIIVQPERIQPGTTITLQTINYQQHYLINDIKIYPQDVQINPSLLVIDVRNAYMSGISEKDKQIPLLMIYDFIWLFPQKKPTIIRAYNSDPLTESGVYSESFIFPSKIKIREDDLKIIIIFSTAFKNTDLVRILQIKGCNNLFLLGLSATGYVLATYFVNVERSYNTFMKKDAPISTNHIHTKVIEDVSNTINIQALMFEVDHIVKLTEKKKV